MLEKGTKIRCINSNGYERKLIINNVYYLVNHVIKNNKDFYDIGDNELYPSEYFSLDVKDFSEERKILKDISIDPYADAMVIKEQISEGPYLYTYWSLRKNKCIKELNDLKVAYDIWYSESMNSIIANVSKMLKDDKDLKKEFNDTYLKSAAKEDRLIIKYHKEEFNNWNKSIKEKQQEVSDLECFVEAVKSRNISLYSIDKSKMLEI